jgi:hypothetical protein
MGNKSEVAKERNRERARARKLVHNHIGTDVFAAAQNWTCPICERSLYEKPPGWKTSADSTWTVDHVYDLATARRHAGNLLIAHASCNMDKRNRHPTRGEQIMLGLVNRCLGYRKGIYKAARVGRGVPNVRPPVADFYEFSVQIFQALWKVIIR